jgi:hypothetical protein
MHATEGVGTEGIDNPYRTPRAAPARAAAIAKKYEVMMAPDDISTELANGSADDSTRTALERRRRRNETECHDRIARERERNGGRASGHRH